MKYLTPDETFWVLDIESDSLSPTVIWVTVVKNILSGETKEFYTKEEFNAWYDGRYSLVGHNILSFDLPNLNRLWGAQVSLGSCVDTLTLSLLYNPAIDGGHSLESWGTRLKYPKGQYSDFSRLTPEMVQYCHQDVNLTLRLYNALTNRMKSLGFSELSCQIEHQIRLVINEQQDNGFWFDKQSAQSFLLQLRQRQSDISKDISRLFPPVRTLVKSGTFKRNKDGSLPAFLEKARDRYDGVVLGYDKGETYEYYSLEEFNIGSPQQRVVRLLDLGWEPQKFTKKGFPQVDEDSLVQFSEVSGLPEISAMAEWLVLQGRSSMLEGWIQNVREDSRIHGRVNSCGATTRRMTHSNPNTANIPSGAKAKYGHECRALWLASPGSVLVGYDAAGLETAGLCHYLNNVKATDILLRPKPDDIHTANARRLSEALERPVDREWGAKTSWYAWLYGAYPAKLGSIVKGSSKDGETVIETFFRNVPGLKELINSVQYEWKTSSGRLACVDGGLVLCPSLSASLNYKIQSLGTILIKLSQIVLRDKAREINLPFKLVGSIHDEAQLEVHQDRAEELGHLAVWSIEEAGRRLKMNVPVTGDFKIGQTWAETH